MKELTAAGVGVTKKGRIQFQTVISKDNLLSLNFAVLFYNCKLFGLRGMDEHRDLASEQYNVSNDEIGKYMYVLLASRLCKNVQGELGSSSCGTQIH